MCGGSKDQPVRTSEENSLLKPRRLPLSFAFWQRPRGRQKRGRLSSGKGKALGAPIASLGRLEGWRWKLNAVRCMF